MRRPAIPALIALSLSLFCATASAEVPVSFTHQGRLLERLERPADALAVYKRYMELYPEQTRPSVASDKVRARLAELDVPEAVENTAKIADRCNVELDMSTSHAPIEATSRWASANVQRSSP